jgi:hypothetical protein
LYDPTFSAQRNDTETPKVPFGFKIVETPEFFFITYPGFGISFSMAVELQYYTGLCLLDEVIGNIWERSITVSNTFAPHPASFWVGSWNKDRKPHLAYYAPYLYPINIGAIARCGNDTNSIYNDCNEIKEGAFYQRCNPGQSPLFSTQYPPNPAVLRNPSNDPRLPLYILGQNGFTYDEASKKCEQVSRRLLTLDSLQNSTILNYLVTQLTASSVDPKRAWTGGFVVDSKCSTFEISADTPKGALSKEDCTKKLPGVFCSPFDPTVVVPSLPNPVSTSTTTTTTTTSPTPEPTSFVKDGMTMIVGKDGKLLANQAALNCSSLPSGGKPLQIVWEQPPQIINAIKAFFKENPNIATILVGGFNRALLAGEYLAAQRGKSLDSLEFVLVINNLASAVLCGSVSGNPLPSPTPTPTPAPQPTVLPYSKDVLPILAPPSGMTEQEAINACRAFFRPLMNIDDPNWAGGDRNSWSQARNATISILSTANFTSTLPRTFFIRSYNNDIAYPELDNTCYGFTMPFGTYVGAITVPFNDCKTGKLMGALCGPVSATVPAPAPVTPVGLESVPGTPYFRLNFDDVSVFVAKDTIPFSETAGLCALAGKSKMMLWNENAAGSTWPKAVAAFKNLEAAKPIVKLQVGGWDGIAYSCTLMMKSTDPARLYHVGVNCDTPPNAVICK